MIVMFFCLDLCTILNGFSCDIFGEAYMHVAWHGTLSLYISPPGLGLFLPGGDAFCFRWKAHQWSKQCHTNFQEHAGLDHGLFWRQDYAQECYHGEHSTLVWGVGIPGLVLLALGWPAFCAAWLYFNMDKLYTDRDFTELWVLFFVKMRCLAKRRSHSILEFYFSILGASQSSTGAVGFPARCFMSLHCCTCCAMSGSVNWTTSVVWTLS